MWRLSISSSRQQARPRPVLSLLLLPPSSSSSPSSSCIAHSLVLHTSWFLFAVTRDSCMALTVRKHNPASAAQHMQFSSSLLLFHSHFYTRPSAPSRECVFLCPEYSLVYWPLQLYYSTLRYSSRFSPPSSSRCSHRCTLAFLFMPRRRQMTAPPSDWRRSIGVAVENQDDDFRSHIRLICILFYCPGFIYSPCHPSIHHSRSLTNSPAREERIHFFTLSRTNHNPNCNFVCLEPANLKISCVPKSLLPYSQWVTKKLYC